VKTLRCAWLAPLAIALLATACSSSSPAGPDLAPQDRSLTDRAAADRSRDGQPALDQTARETGKSDLTKPPARWELVTGTAVKIYEHTATLLKDGRVLVAGGRPTPATASSEAYLFDPAANAFQKTTPMGKQRWYHTATRLLDGRVLVAGGSGPGSTPLDSTELFDPTSATWSSGPPLPGPRAGHCALLLGNGDLLLIGGYSKATQLNSLVLFHAGSWIQLATGMASKRAGHAATLLANGKVLTVGGYDGSYLDTLEVFDPASGNSTALTAKLTDPRSQTTASLLPNGKVLIVGGMSAENGVAALGDDLYDPGTDSVVGVTHPGTVPFSHAAATLLDGRVLITGGTGGPTAVLYSAALGGWSTAPSLGGPRDDHTATTLLDGSVLVCGGLKGVGVFAESAERFYP
jgi:N-acetylneuraminic acid mutarotase